MEKKNIILGLVVFIFMLSMSNNIYSAHNELSNVEYESYYINNLEGLIYTNLTFSVDSLNVEYQINFSYKENENSDYILIDSTKYNISKSQNLELTKLLDNLEYNTLYNTKMTIDSETTELQTFTDDFRTDSNNNVFDYNFNLESTLLIIFVLLIFSFLAFFNIMRIFSSLVIVIIGFILLDLHLLIGLIIIMYGFIISLLEV